MGVLDSILSATVSQIALAATGVAMFTYCQTSKERYKYISDLHSIPAVGLATLSVMEIIPEWVPIIFSSTYMAVDGVGMTYRLLRGTAFEDMDWMFVLHHVGVLGMNVHPFTGPAVYYSIRMTSKCLFVEVSNPFLHRWERTKNYSDFLLVYPIFVAVRTVWLGYLCYDAHTAQYSKYIHWLGIGLWGMCFFTWTVPNFKLLNYDTHEAMWRAKALETKGPKDH